MFSEIINRYIIASCLMLIACNGTQTQEAENQSDSTNVTVDAHSAARPYEAITKHLDLSLNVNFFEKKISGKASYVIENKKQVDSIYFDAKDLNIEKVTLGNEDKITQFELLASKHGLGSSLAIRIEPTTTVVNIYYSSNPNAKALQWLVPQQTADKKFPFMFTQSQSVLARTWVPCQDGPGIRITYTAVVQVPSELMAVMSAENPMERNKTGIYNFKMDKPIPSYLLALAVGDLSFAPISDRTGVYAEPSVIEKASYEFAEMEKMLKVTENLYGPYNWGRYDVIVLPPSFPFGGMENPKLTFATPTVLAGDRSLTALVAHEMAHSWSGNLVTNSTWNDFWLNEGFSVYFERRIMEELYGKSYAEMLALLGYQDLMSTVEELGPNSVDTKLKLNLDGRDPEEAINDIPYEKGYFFLRLIEETVGREKWDAFLKNYFQTFSFQSMSTEYFIGYMSENLFKNDKSLIDSIAIDSWVYGTGIPVNCPKVHSERFDNVDIALKEWNNGTPAKKLSVKEWTTHEWLHFLRHLPTMSNNQMNELDNAFKFTVSGNSEILCVWLQHAITNKYEKANDALDNFLINVGRRKFLAPLYKLLIKTEEGKIHALKVYEKARPNYHSVSYLTIDEILGMKGI